jgi:hypothetical protein
MKLLTTAQYKLDKSTGYGWSTVGINLSPANEASHILGTKMRNMCTNSGHCETVCLNGTGHNVMTSSGRARAARTRLWVERPDFFLKCVLEEIDAARRKATKEGLKFAVRPNLLSDQRNMALRLAKARPEIQFYDYTKLPPNVKSLPKNYHVTFLSLIHI